MKQNIPIQEEIIRKVEENAELSLAVIGNIDIVLREERECYQVQGDTYEKGFLSSKERFKLTDKKNPN